MKLVVLMAIMGSIWGCGTEQANVDEATNKNVEHKEMAAETERQDESNEGASKGQDAVISDDAMSSDTNTESKSEDDCLKTWISLKVGKGKKMNCLLDFPLKPSETHFGFLSFRTET